MRVSSVPESPSHAVKHVPVNLLTKAYVEGTMDGLYVGG